jgi:hypothetical protein
MEKIEENTNHNKMKLSPACGLFNNKSNEMIPLKYFYVGVEIVEDFAKVLLTQEYVNLTNEVISTSFNFPKTSGSIFDSLTINCEGKEMVGVLDERKKLQIKYKESISKGETAVLAETGDVALSDVITCKIGNLQPYQHISVTFGYIEKVKISQNKHYSFVFPQVLQPRYISNKEFRKLYSSYIKGEDLSSTPLLDYITNYKIAEDNKNGCFKTPWNIQLSISSAKRVGNVKVVSSSLVSISQGDDKTKVTISLINNEPQYTSDDFTIEYDIEDFQSPKFLMTKHPRFTDDYAMYLSFNPKFEFLKFNSIDEDEQIANFKGTFYFLLDRSGSMGGDRIKTAKTALIFFLKSIPEGSKFNILSFGSQYKLMYDTEVEVNNSNIKEALKLVGGIDADMGGTELKEATYYLIERTKSLAGPVRIFYLTDGQITNTKEVLDMISGSRNSEQDVLYYALGIGSGCSEDLVDGIADRGLGRAEYARNTNQITDKVIYLLENSIMKTVSIKLRCSDESISKCFALNSSLPLKNLAKTTFNENIELYSTFNAKEIPEKVELNLEVTFLKEDGNASKHVFTLQAKKNDIICGNFLHKLWVKTQLEKNTAKLAREISIKYGILNNYTALFCVVKEKEDSYDDLMKKIQVDEDAGYDRLIDIIVKSLTGKDISIQLPISSTISQLKEIVCERDGIPPDQQRMVCQGKRLTDNRLLTDYDIDEGSIIHLVLSLRASGEGDTPIDQTDIMQVIYKKSAYAVKYNKSKCDYDTLIGKILTTLGKLELKFYYQDKELCKNISTFPKKIYAYDLDEKVYSSTLHEQLVGLQRTDGLWDSDKELIDLLQLDESAWDAFKEKVNSFEKSKNITVEQKESVIVTLFVLTLFKQKFPENLDSLKMIIKKAENKLKKLLLENFDCFVNEIKFNELC